MRLSFLLSGAVAFSIFLSSCGPDKGHGDGVWVPNPKDSSALGMRDHFIPKDSIEVYRKRFNQDRDTLAVKMPSLFIPFSEAFNKKSILELMKDSNCVGIRIYYGATAIDGRGMQDLRMIVVGVDKKGGDLYVPRPSAEMGKPGDPGDPGGFEYGQCTPPCEDGGAR